LLTKPDNSLATKYLKMEKRYDKLILRGIKLRKKEEERIKEYNNSTVTDHEWELYLQRISSYLALAEDKLKTARGKMDQVRKNLKIKTFPIRTDN